MTTAKRYTTVQVLKMVRSEVERAGSQRALAREWGISVAYLSDVLRGNRHPGPSICGPLGLKPVVRYERHEHFERDGGTRQR